MLLLHLKLSLTDYTAQPYCNYFNNIIDLY